MLLENSFLRHVKPYFKAIPLQKQPVLCLTGLQKAVNSSSEWGISGEGAELWEGRKAWPHTQANVPGTVQPSLFSWTERLLPC